MKIMLVGSGSWGIALALLLNSNGHEVTMWTNYEEERDLLIKERSNPKLLPNAKIPMEIDITCDLSRASECELVVMAVPSFAVYATAVKLSAIINEGTIIVNVGKGLDRENNYCRFSESITRATSGKNPVVALTGPTHAEEVADKMPTTILSASKDKASAVKVQEIFMTDYFRVYTNEDIIGAELGGALKNVIALAAGICDGMGLGDNAKAGLMTRGLTEIARLGVKLGAKRETFAGLSGIGDLVVTCTSMHSRNRRAGILIGKGVDTQEAMKQVGAVVEGYFATEAAFKLAQNVGVEMPIVEAMYDVLYNGTSSKDGLKLLMGRGAKAESEEIWISDN